MRDKLIRMMYGRNGMDELARFLNIAALLILVISIFVPGTISILLWLVALGLLIWTYVRIFSKNLYKRQAENARYVETKMRVRGYFRTKKEQFKLRKYYCFFKCPGCSVTIRIPKGKGNGIITCPRCRTSFNGHT